MRWENVRERVVWKEAVVACCELYSVAYTDSRIPQKNPYNSE